MSKILRAVSKIFRLPLQVRSIFLRARGGLFISSAELFDFHFPIATPARNPIAILSKLAKCSGLAKIILDVTNFDIGGVRWKVCKIAKPYSSRSLFGLVWTVSHCYSGIMCRIFSRPGNWWESHWNDSSVIRLLRGFPRVCLGHRQVH